MLSLGAVREPADVVGGLCRIPDKRTTAAGSGPGGTRRRGSLRTIPRRSLSRIYAVTVTEDGGNRRRSAGNGASRDPRAPRRAGGSGRRAHHILRHPGASPSGDPASLELRRVRRDRGGPHHDSVGSRSYAWVGDRLRRTSPSRRRILQEYPRYTCGDSRELGEDGGPFVRGLLSRTRVERKLHCMP